MGNDIFNRVVDLGQPLAADATRLILPASIGLSGEDMLVQNFAINYAQNVTRLWEVGTQKTYFFAGRTQGSINIKRIIGNKGTSSAFIKQYGDVCNMAGNHLSVSMEAGCSAAEKRGSLTAAACVITAVAYSIAAADMIINEDVTLMFARLEGN